MIRNSRGIHIHRIVQEMQYTHRPDNQRKSANVNRMLPNWKTILACRNFLNRSRTSTTIPFRIKISLDRAKQKQYRLYNTSHHVMLSMSSTIKQHEESRDPLANADDIGGHDYIKAPDSGPHVSPLNVTLIHEF